MRASALLILVLAAGCRPPGSGSRLPGGYLVPSDASPAEPVPGPGPARLHDRTAEALRLPPLASVALPEGERELRLSTGHGMILGAEYPMLRIRSGPWGAAGEMVFYRAVPSHDQAAPGSGSGWRWTARRTDLTPPPDWGALVARLDRLRVTTAVGRSPDGRAIMDAGQLLVEARDGSAYVVYDVNAPRWRQDADGRRAAAIAHIVDSLARAARRISTRR